MNTHSSEIEPETWQNTLLYYMSLSVIQGLVGYLGSESVFWPVVFSIIFLFVVNFVWHLIAAIVVLWFFSKKSFRDFFFKAKNVTKADTEAEERLKKAFRKTSYVLVLIPLMIYLALLTYALIARKTLTATQLVPLTVYFAWGVFGVFLARKDKICPFNINNEVTNEINEHGR